MCNVILADAWFYTWALLPLLFFAARVLDVSLGTVRLIFVSRGMKYLAPLVGFFEVLTWLLAIGQIMKNLSNPACYIAYAAGFAMGNFVGICIAERLSLGVVLVRVVTQKDASPLVDKLKARDYGLTCVDGHGTQGQVKILFTIVPRREVRNLVMLIKEFNPGAFYSVEEVGFVEKGIFPLKTAWADLSLLKLFRFFRKGK